MTKNKRNNKIIALIAYIAFILPNLGLTWNFNDYENYFTYEQTQNTISIYGNFFVQQNNPDTWGMIAQNRLTSTKIVTITAYSSTPDQTDSTPFITAYNTFVRDGIVAANFLKFGTKIKIPRYFGDKIFTVEDRMHQRFSNRVDIWFPTRQDAKNFGVKITELVVLQ
ncbi:MAG: hypothetical protein AAB397_01795 [Patescibacteria group bacterium]